MTKYVGWFWKKIKGRYKDFQVTVYFSVRLTTQNPNIFHQIGTIHFLKIIFNGNNINQKGCDQMVELNMRHLDLKRTIPPPSSKIRFHQCAVSVQNSQQFTTR